MKKINFKNIHIGKLIEIRSKELKIEETRISNFMKCSREEIKAMYKEKSLNTELLLKWSKLLEYDFFRIYSQHLILYAPQSNTSYNRLSDTPSSLPHFRKNIYTIEIISFILGQIETGEMTKAQVIERYKIPRTTLYKWTEKYK